jgi:hypothetical protein
MTNNSPKKVDLSEMLNMRSMWVIRFYFNNEPALDGEELDRIGYSMSVTAQRNIACKEVERLNRLKQEADVTKTVNFVVGCIAGSLIAWAIDMLVLR